MLEKFRMQKSTTPQVILGYPPGYIPPKQGNPSIKQSLTGSTSVDNFHLPKVDLKSRPDSFENDKKNGILKNSSVDELP